MLTKNVNWFNLINKLELLYHIFTFTVKIGNLFHAYDKIESFSHKKKTQS